MMEEERLQKRREEEVNQRRMMVSAGSAVATLPGETGPLGQFAYSLCPEVTCCG